MHLKQVAETFGDQATCKPEKISFRDLFRDGEDTDQEAGSLATVLTEVRMKWPGGFRASDVTAYLSMGSTEALQLKAAIEDATGGKPIMVITAVALTWRLKAITEAPVVVEKNTLVLKYTPDPTKNGGVFSVKTLGPPSS